MHYQLILQLVMLRFFKPGSSPEIIVHGGLILQELSINKSNRTLLSSCLFVFFFFRPNTGCANLFICAHSFIRDTCILKVFTFAVLNDSYRLDNVFSVFGLFAMILPVYYLCICVTNIDNLK